MKLLFKQRFFSWLDSYDIYDVSGNVVYVIKGKISFGHLLKIYDSKGNEKGYIQERVFSFLPKFEMYVDNKYVGCIKKEFTFFKPKFYIDYKDWSVEGDWTEWDYEIKNRNNQIVAKVSKEIFNWTDTYSIDIANPEDTIFALMLVLAIDAEKCSRNNN